jgi:hypothetical protein
MKKIIFSVLLMIFFLGLTGCAKNNNGNPNQENNNQAKQNESTGIKGDVGNDTCAEFSADFIYSATGKAVVKVEPDWAVPKLACRYYFTYADDFYKGVTDKRLSAGGLHVFMMLENSNVVDQRKAMEFLGVTIKTDPRIKMEHSVDYRENGTVWDIRLIINPNRYLRMDSNGGLTDDELIQFAAKVAEKIQGNLSFAINNNPIKLADSEEEVGPSQQAVAVNFFDTLAKLKISEALKMMDANDSTKQMWQTNFSTLQSLKVDKIEEAFKEEWTSTHQTFKVELNVSVSPAGEQLGWSNGKNFRWVTLEKNASGQWLIHEIANNP